MKGSRLAKGQSNDLIDYPVEVDNVSRCLKSNLECSGYAPPKIRLFEPAPMSTPTPPPMSVPMSTMGISTTSARSQPSNTPQLQSYLDNYPHPHTLALAPSFGTDEDYRSFQFFLEKTSSLISVYSQPYLWTVLLPQASFRQPAIKHSILALATLHQSLTNLESTVAARENQAFMSHYNLAIRALVTDKPPVDVVLSTCVIFWALENFNGSGTAAFDHMKAAIKILGEWKATKRPDDPSNDLITKYIEPTICEGIKFASKLRVDQLQDQMKALSLSAQDYRVLSLEYPAFEGLEQAAAYLRDCILEILHLTITLKSLTPSLRDQIEGLEARLNKWMHLFQPLTATGPVHERKMLVVHDIAAYCLLSRLKLKAGISDPKTMQPGRDRYAFIVVEVEDMLKYDPYCTDLTKNTRPLLGFVPAVFLAATTAPKAQTRQRAINALRLLDAMNGPWCGKLAASVAEVMLEIAQQFSLPVAELDIEQMNFEYDLQNGRLSLIWQPDDEHLQGFSYVKELTLENVSWADGVSSLSPSDVFCINCLEYRALMRYPCNSNVFRSSYSILDIANCRDWDEEIGMRVCLDWTISCPLDRTGIWSMEEGALRDPATAMSTGYLNIRRREKERKRTDSNPHYSIVHDFHAAEIPCQF